ncbi:hypothetical protein M406DRAFT_291320 [Cryphonectria parasitica EP155]|uniref:Uncharacterized protein n=1 Tax=Cryphonectria parasitica (strain ATCC 38755 / EP155) TaxID=660469 RepID=A0A9P5CNF4_CRYP1|nr:uncharacterized protein M406DRAFT_291320 [Cryphonectria parasitica EP155]KAF3764267.1 hypothetical protein M406DRAFT_291320 [Cryphonectria parasitica EP155]
MDDPPAWAEPWPFWKFGLKQRDLNTTLHDRFNTITTPIQDSEAFHHDVFELSSKASDLAEFERMMEDRKALRLKELNGMLDDASFEIIGNPRLIGTEQWGLAIQLFRTKSLDSLVRYFSSYLPSDHPWHPDSDTCSNSTTGDADLLNGPHADYDGPILFDEPDEDDTIYTHEHSEAFSRCDTAVDHPTRSNSLRSQDSGVSVNERVQRKADHQPHPTSQAMSVPESEPDHIAASLQSSVPTLHHDEAPSPSDDPETPSSASDILQTEDQAHRKDGLMTTTIPITPPTPHPQHHFSIRSHRPCGVAIYRRVDRIPTTATTTITITTSLIETIARSRDNYDREKVVWIVTERRRVVL